MQIPERGEVLKVETGPMQIFHSEIINDTDKLNAELNAFKPIPQVSFVKHQQVIDNYFQVKLDIKALIEQEV